MRSHTTAFYLTDVLFYVYTSGTTGNPKACKIPHERLVENFLTFDLFIVSAVAAISPTISSLKVQNDIKQHSQKMSKSETFHLHSFLEVWVIIVTLHKSHILLKIVCRQCSLRPWIEHPIHRTWTTRIFIWGGRYCVPQQPCIKELVNWKLRSQQESEKCICMSNWQFCSVM